MKFQTIVLLVTCALFQGCSHRSELSLDKVERLQLGASQSEVEREFGKPTDIFETAPDRNSAEWFYIVGDYNRAVFEIDHSTGRLVSKFWDVREGDEVRKIERALARYPNAHFKLRDSTVKPPHGGPGYTWYEDAASGIGIQIRKGHNAVESIVWCRDEPKRSCRRD